MHISNNNVNIRTAIIAVKITKQTHHILNVLGLCVSKPLIHSSFKRMANLGYSLVFKVFTVYVLYHNSYSNIQESFRFAFHC